MTPLIAPEAGEIFTVGISRVSDCPATEEMREIMRGNSRSLEEMLRKFHEDATNESRKVAIAAARRMGPLSQIWIDHTPSQRTVPQIDK